MADSQNNSRSNRLIGGSKAPESSSFLRRALILQGELQGRRYPNASKLAEMCGCSRSTAMRTIDRLRYEFGVPIDYDESSRGYYLTNPEYSFEALPPGRDELVAFLLLSEFASMIDDKSLQGAVLALWTRMTNGRSDVEHELDHIRNRFSSEVSITAKLKDVNLVSLLILCHQGQMVRVRYCSPWHDDTERDYVGLFEKVHFADGIVYAMFCDEAGVKSILNVSFIKAVSECLEGNRPKVQTDIVSSSESHWFEGIGTWSGATAQTIEITIPPPAARYFAAQTWHRNQVDKWQGGHLIRSFPGVPSPELSRRVLSLGRFITSIKPECILDLIREDIRHLFNLCKGK